MSEHIQSLSGGRETPESSESRGTHAPRSELHERTPGVAYERETFNFRLILWVGAGLAVTVVVVQGIVWWLLGGLEKYDVEPSGSVSELALEDAKKPLGQRLDNVPPPHLEGIERESSLLVIRTENGEEARFFVSGNVHVRIGEEEKARLFELREGQRVTLTYYMPGGVGGGLGVVTAVVSETNPPVKSEQKTPEPEQANVSRTIDGEIIRIEPRGIAASREWGEVQMGRYGWIDRDKGIVHVPVEEAMDAVLQSKEFRKEGNPKKGDGRTVLPTRSSSGRAVKGGQR